MNVLLVNCIIKVDYGEPVGILFLASYLRSLGHRVEVYDPQILGDEDLQGLRARCTDGAYGLVGFSVLTSSDQALALVDQMSSTVRALSPSSRICCGGVGASLRFEEFVALPQVDYVILGEGEQTLAELLEALAAGADPSGLPGLVSHLGRGFTPRQLIPDLDTLPFMARDTLVERLALVPLANRQAFEVRIFCGRGCPGSCAFCANASVSRLGLGKRCRQRSLGSLLLEMEQVHSEHGVDRFSFWDDNFLPPGAAGVRKAEELRAAFRNLSFQPRFGIQTRPDTISREALGVLREAGLQNVYLGVENINQEELRRLGKHITPDQIRASLTVLQDHGYAFDSEASHRLRVGYIAFTPFTTLESYRENVEFICAFRLPIEKIGKKLLAFHATPMRRLLEREGLLTGDFEWRFKHEGIAILFEATRRIIGHYQGPYEQLRFMGKVIKYNAIPHDFTEFKSIKLELEARTILAIKELAALAPGDLVRAEGAEALAAAHAGAIQALAAHHDLDRRITAFRQERQREIEQFERASYVFFD